MPLQRHGASERRAWHVRTACSSVPALHHRSRRPDQPLRAASPPSQVALMRSVFGDDQTTREAERQFLGELSQAGGSTGGSSRFETAAVTAVFLLLVLGLVKALVYMADILSAA